LYFSPITVPKILPKLGGQLKIRLSVYIKDMCETVLLHVYDGRHNDVVVDIGFALI